MAQSRTIRTAKRRVAFLKMLRDGTSISDAAAAVGAGRTAIYDWRDEDPTFRAEWDDAVEHATELVESVLYKQAREGNLLACIFWLKAHKPAVYNRKMQVTIGGDRNNPLTVDHAHQDAPSVVRIYRIPDNGRDSDADIEIEGEGDEDVA
jgi:hypothetical protein